MTIKYTHSQFYLQTCLEEMIMPTCGIRVQRVQGSDFPQWVLQFAGSPQKSGEKKIKNQKNNKNTKTKKSPKHLSC